MLRERDIQILGDLVVSGHLGLTTANRLIDAVGTEDRGADGRNLRETFEEYLDQFQKERTALEPLEETQLLDANDGEQSVDTAPDKPDRTNPSVDDIDRGTTLPGSERYSLEQRLGEGSAGVVWLAHDEVLQRTVALKVLDQSVDDATEQARRFLFEAQTTGRLDHPGVIPVYDVGRLPDGRWFYTMQLIDERDFQDVLWAREDTDSDDRRPLPRLLELFSRVCLTVAYAHDSGIIHRDIKPANILLGAYGEVYVVDWGLAMLYSDGNNAEHRTPEPHEDGELAGTPYYMSPEQIRGENSDLGPAADVFALGVVLYRVLTGQFPFEADSVTALLLKVETEEPPDPREAAPKREVPDPLAGAALQAMSHEPDDRMSARQLAERITDFLEGVEERRRRAERADKLIDRARALHQAYLQTRETVESRRERLEERLAELDPSDGLEVRKPLWERQHAIDERAHEAEELYSKCVQATRESLQLHDTADARRLLTDLYWYKLQEAREERDEAKALYFRSLVEEYDDGRYTDRLADHGTLAVDLPGDTEASLFRETAVGPIFELEEVEVDWEAMPVDLETGTYRLRLETRDLLTVEQPVEITGARQTNLDPDVPSAPADDAFCFVPSGRYTFGGDELAPKSLPETTLDIEGFLIRTHPVTVGEYCDFLNDLAQRDFERAKSHSPRSTDGSVYYLEIDERKRRFSVPEQDAEGHEWESDWPVIMINWYDAHAFVEWVGERDDANYQLPTEIQWEVAARGIDGRMFPWGSGFDPALCRMAESVNGRPVPTSVGSYPYDRSPYGVQDMAGLVIEWTRTQSSGDGNQYIQRGGSFNSPSNWCRAAARKNNQADDPYFPFGFRYVLEL